MEIHGMEIHVGKTVEGHQKAMIPVPKAQEGTPRHIRVAFSPTKAQTSVALPTAN
jgi:hypothetical protein